MTGEGGVQNDWGGVGKGCGWGWAGPGLAVFTSGGVLVGDTLQIVVMFGFDW